MKAMHTAALFIVTWQEWATSYKAVYNEKSQTLTAGFSVNMFAYSLKSHNGRALRQLCLIQFC